MPKKLSTQKKLRLLQQAQKLNNVTLACNELGVSRVTYYRLKKSLLKSKPNCPVCGWLATILGQKSVDKIVVAWSFEVPSAQLSVVFAFKFGFCDCFYS